MASLVEDGSGNLDVKVEQECRIKAPTHLIIMANGLNGSAQNWKFSAKQFLRKYPDDVIVHCSKCNSAKSTFDGVDVMGERLAEEVVSVVRHHPSVKEISFIGHSLGGLVARYAIARLYEQEASHGNGVCENDGSEESCLEKGFKGKIAGLEPINFITSATPHLGSKGHKQVPVFCGVYIMEKVAPYASSFFGRTIKHLFSTDNDDGKPPLLLRMTRDTEDLKFISALQCFKRRVAYANAHFDHLVGWSTSSLRHRDELPKLKNLSRHDKYEHIVNVETAKIAGTLEQVPTESRVNECKNVADMKGEEMLRGLTKLSWERVDVSFSGSRQRYFAHSTILVKNYFINSDGADVIQHMIDNFLL